MSDKPNPLTCDPSELDRLAAESLGWTMREVPIRRGGTKVTAKPGSKRRENETVNHSPSEAGCVSALVSGILSTGITLIICLRVIFAYSEAIEDLKQQAIEHGAAEYDSTTGAWRWKENLMGESQ